MRDRSVGDEGSWYKFAIARTSAAKPAALEAKPAAVGKLFSLTIFSFKSASLGRLLSFASTSLRSWRSSRRHACVLAPEMSWSLPLRVRESLVMLELHDAVVCVRRSSCERVTERDELVGRFSLVSRLPQYLRSLSQHGCANGCLCIVVLVILDHGDVDWSVRARAVYLVACHGV